MCVNVPKDGQGVGHTKVSRTDDRILNFTPYCFRLQRNCFEMISSLSWNGNKTKHKSGEDDNITFFHGSRRLE